MKQRVECEYPDCHQTKHGARHEGFKADHDFQPPAKQGFGSVKKPMNRRSESPRRVERYEDSQRKMQEHREAVPYCQAREYGLKSPCGTGPVQGKIDQQHVIARGAGGGKDHGKLISLCHEHHMWAESHRSEARALGLSERAPVPDKVPPRRSATPRATEPPAPAGEAQRRPRSRL